MTMANPNEDYATMQAIQHEDSAFAAASNRDHIFSGGNEGLIIKTDRRTGDEVSRSVKCAHGGNFPVRNRVYRIVVSRNSSMIVTSGGYTSRIVKVWNMDLELTQSLEGHEDNVFSVAMSPNSSMIVSGGTDGEVKVWKKG